MLALFEPGNEPVPWLGNLLRLGPLDDLNASSQDPFPVKLLGKYILIFLVKRTTSDFRFPLAQYCENVTAE